MRFDTVFRWTMLLSFVALTAAHLVLLAQMALRS